MADRLPREFLDFLDQIALNAPERRRPLNEGEKYVLHGMWSGLTYDEMVNRSEGRYKKNYLMQTVGPQILKFLSEHLGLKLNKANFRSILEHKISILPSAAGARHLLSDFQASTEATQSRTGQPTNYFSETLDVSRGTFVGREDERETLKAAIANRQLRVTLIKGFAGVGKSSLAYSIATDEVQEREITENFDSVIFMSLRRRRSAVEFVQEILQRGFNFQDLPTLPEDVKPIQLMSLLINELIQCLSRFRCLLVIDNFDSIFNADGLLDFEYSNEDYQDLIEKLDRTSNRHYQELVEQLASTGHKSHVIFTCRAFPQAIIDDRLIRRPFYQMELKGLTSDDIKMILVSRKLRDVSEDDVQQLTSRLGGVPLGVRLAIADIETRYSGSLSQYIKNAEVPESIEILIRDLIRGLSSPEQRLLHQVASYGRAVSYSELSDDISDDDFNELKENIKSLRGRSLLSLDSSKRYDAHPLVAEISRENILSNCVPSIKDLNFGRLDELILVKASGDESDRQEQLVSFLDPFKDKLLEEFGTKQALIDQLKLCLQTLQQSPARWRRYAAGNIFNLLRRLDPDLESLDISGLVLQHADFRGVNLQRANLSGAELIDCVLPEALGCPDVVVFSPKDDRIAVGDADGRVRLWRFDGVTWQLDRRFAREHTGWIWSLSFSPDGELLASGGDDGTVRLWRVNGKKNRSFLPPLKLGGSVKSVAFSADFSCGVQGNDSGFIAATNDEGILKLWSASAPFEVISDPALEQIQAIRVATSPVHNGTITFATSSNTGKIQLWSWFGDNIHLKWESFFHSTAVYALAFSPDGQLLATGAADGTVGFLHVETGEPVFSSSTDSTEQMKHSDAVWSVAFSRDGQLAATASYDQAVLLWDTKDATSLRTLKNQHQGKVLGVTFNQTSRLREHILVSASDDKTVKSFRVTSDLGEKKNWKIQTNHLFAGLTGWVWQTSFSPDGKLLASACDDGQVLLLNCNETLNNTINLERMAVFRSDVTRSWAVAFSPNSEVLATGGSDREVKLWDLKTKRRIDCLAGHADPIRALAFSADGNILASASADSNIILWDSRDLDDYLVTYRKKYAEDSDYQGVGIVESITTLTDHQEEVWTLTFSHNDRILATAGAEGKIILYQFDGGTDDVFRFFAPSRRKSETQSISLEEHSDTVWALVFNSDDSLLISASSDRTIKLWDMQTYKCVDTLEGHTDQIHALSITADGKFLISSGNDATIMVWDLHNRKHVKTLEHIHQHWIWAISCHPRLPSLIASGSLDETISLRDLVDNKEIARFLNQPFADCLITGLIASSSEKERLIELGAKTFVWREGETA